MKPDVLKQMEEIEEKRKKITSENNGTIMLQQDGKEPIQLTQQQVLQHLNDQNKKMQNLVQLLKDRDKTIFELKNNATNNILPDGDRDIFKELDEIKLLLAPNNISNCVKNPLYYHDYNLLIK